MCAGSVCRSVKKNEKYKNSDSTRGKGGYYSRTSILFLKLTRIIRIIMSSVMMFPTTYQISRFGEWGQYLERSFLLFSSKAYFRNISAIYLYLYYIYISHEYNYIAINVVIESKWK